MRSQWSCFLSFISSTFLLSWQPPKFICHALFAPHTRTQRDVNVCVCVYNLRFSLFSHSSLRSALKFKQSAINYTCWALSIFHFPLASTRFLFFLSTFFAPLKHLHTLGRRAEFQYVAGSLSQQHPLQCCVTHCVTHSVTPSVWQSGSLSLCQSSALAVCQLVRNATTAQPLARAWPNSALPIISRAIFIN